MLHRNYHRLGVVQTGFTLVELVVSMTLIFTLMLMFNIFIANNYQSYISLQENTIRTNELSNGVQRVGRVLRGINVISDANAQSITGYAYFTPRDTTFSRVRYFYNSTNQSLQVGVIAASGTAPNYTYPLANEQVSTVVQYVDGTQPIFRYVNLAGDEDTFDSSSYKDIKSIKIALKSIKRGGALSVFQAQTMVSLRNRKTNL